MLSDYAASRLVRPPHGGRETAGRNFPINQHWPMFDGCDYVTVGPPQATLVCLWMRPWRYKIKMASQHRKQALDLSFHVTFPSKPWPIAKSSKDAARRMSPVFDPSAKPPKCRGTIIVLQGWDGRAADNFGLWPISMALANAGYRVILPDLRGQGYSGGGTIGLGTLDVRDLKQVITQLTKEGVIKPPIGVLGHSYGAGVAILLAAKDKRVKAVVALSPWERDFKHMVQVGSAWGQQDAPIAWGLFGWMFNKQVMDQTIVKVGTMTGVNPYSPNNSPAVAITKTDTPILLIHGSADQHCPVRWSEDLYSRRTYHTKFIEFMGENHWSYLFDRWPALRGAVLGWFRRYVQKAG